jgi:signal transduction histidine kinase
MTAVRTLGLARSRDDRVLGGVCGGMARTLGIDPVVVRFGFLALALAGGVGAVGYGALWALLPDGAEAVPEQPPSRRDDVAALAIVAGAVLVLRSLGIWFGDEIAAVGGAAVVGVALVTGRSAPDSRRGPAGAARLAVGAALVLLGFGLFAAWTADLQTIGRSVLGALVLASGMALLMGPRVARLARELAAERRARLRSEERAEIAAHLHDGVLQTLSLIQRRAGGNREVAALARRQERELRGWLYGAAPGIEANDSLDAALQRELAAVEDDHQIPVELVCVGDAGPGDTTTAVVAAVREAAANAARHSGADRVDVYVEVAGDRIVAYVRDRGRGFDPAAVPPQRHGLAGSVIGRMQRVGGTAVVRSAPGAGTEVTVEVGVPRA